MYVLGGSDGKGNAFVFVFLFYSDDVDLGDESFDLYCDGDVFGHSNEYLNSISNLSRVGFVAFVLGIYSGICHDVQTVRGRMDALLLPLLLYISHAAVFCCV